jgi:hypothetical protein
MQMRLSGFFSKFFFEILPATLASAVAGFLFAHFGMPPFQQAAQQAAAVSPVSEEMLKMVHDDHEAFVDYLKKSRRLQALPPSRPRPGSSRRSNPPRWRSVRPRRPRPRRWPLPAPPRGRSRPGHPRKFRPGPPPPPP